MRRPRETARHPIPAKDASRGLEGGDTGRAELMECEEEP